MANSVKFAFWALQKRPVMIIPELCLLYCFVDLIPKQFFQYFASIDPFILLVEIMMNETTPFRRKLTHCFGAN